MANGTLHKNPQHHKPNPQNKKNPSKFYSNFIFKSIIFILFLVIIPLFPSYDSQDVNNTNNNPSSIFSRWWWELFHLIFVGIAVSYGLFSRKNDDLHSDNNHTHNNNNNKFENAQSYMSKLLQVPAVFDDDLDDDNVNSPTDSSTNVKKIQTWSSLYYRNQPVLVVAKDGSFVDNNNSFSKSGSDNNNPVCPTDVKSSFGVGEKPLLLPVRSLKSRVCDEKNDVEKVNSREYARSNSSDSSMSRVSKGYTRSNSKRISRNDMNDEFGFVNGNGEVSRSLIKSSSSLSSRRKSSSEDYRGLDNEGKVEDHVVLPSPIPWRSRTGSMDISSRESCDGSLHSLPPSLEESGAAQLLRSQSSLSSRIGSSSSSPKELSPSPSLSSPKRVSPSPSLSSEALAKSAEDFGRRKVVYGSKVGPPPPPPPPPPMHRSQLAKSSSSKDKGEVSSRNKELKRSIQSEPNGIDRNLSHGRNVIDFSSLGKSVRTIRAGEARSSRRNREFEEQEEISEDIDSDVNEKSERSGYTPISNQSFSEFPKETRDFLEHVLVETDDESGTEEENFVEEPVHREPAKAEEPPSDSVDEGPDVDKKADEFIAKFREQIRLQRIESIKRSTGQLKRSSIR